MVCYLNICIIANIYIKRKLALNKVIIQFAFIYETGAMITMNLMRLFVETWM